MGRSDMEELMKQMTKTRWCYLGCAVLMLLIMIRYSMVQTFWYDEMYQLGMVSEKYSIWEVIYNYSLLQDYTPPLYALIAAVWVRIVPFSSVMYLLISEIPVAVGIYLLSCLGERIYGKRTGILCAVIGLVSSVLMLSGGLEFRAYGLYFFLSVIAVYVWYLRLEKPTMKRTVWYGVSLILLVYSHYFGAVLCGGLFFADLFFYVRKQIKSSAILSYVMAGISFLPWMGAILFNKQGSMSEFWINPPNLTSVKNAILYLNSDSHELYIVFLFAISLFLVEAIFAFQKKKFENLCHGVSLSMIWLILFVMGSIFIYSVWINPKGGIFWNRYFLGLVPCCIFLSAAALSRICNFFVGEKKVLSCIVIAVFLCLIVGQETIPNLSEGAYKENSYDKAYNVLKKKQDIEKDTTAIVIGDNHWVRDGFEYYFKYGDKTLDVNLITQYEENIAEDILKYKKLYVFKAHEVITWDTIGILDKYYVKKETDEENGITVYRRRKGI